MNSLSSLYRNADGVLVLIMLIALCVITVWLVVLNLHHRRLARRFNTLFAAASTGTVPGMLAEHLGTVQRIARQTSAVEERLDRLMAIFPSVVRHVGLVRFSPFHDTGGDQSFSMAILDGERNGVVLSVLHSRQESRLYAKPIVAGSSPYTLTGEEIRAIDHALTESASQTHTG